MTITGKCETCRQRKVKCDEKKPACSPCCKGNRSCAYNFGNISAIVVEDPTKFSKHGKTKVAPMVYPLMQFSDITNSSPVSPLSKRSFEPADFQTTTERDADQGKGVFRTLAMVSRDKANAVRKQPSARRKRRLEIHLDHLKRASALLLYRPSAPTVALASRYISLLQARPSEQQPFSILGSWILSIPSRIGNSGHVDLAVEYMIDSFNVYRQDNFTNRNVALTSKAEALKVLQIAVDNEKSRATYDTILAMKIHFAAEIFMGIHNGYHMIHSVGLAEILREGPPVGFDEEHYWSFLDQTYMDDVSEAAVAGRVSVYDNEFYLNATSPSSIPSDATTFFRASTALMHVFVQLPRLICLVRHAIQHSDEDTDIRASAISLAESLWMLDPSNIIKQVMLDSTILIPTPPHPDVADIITDSYHFNSVDSSIQASRYWYFVINLCGVTEMLYLQFPTEAANSLLPDIETVHQRDIDAAISLARCVRYSLDTCPSLPLVPLRLHTHFQISVGTWYRLIRRLERQQEALSKSNVTNDNPLSPNLSELDLTEKLRKAQRMEQWVIDECNRLHVEWKVDPVHKKFLTAAVEDMSGGPIPDWLPTSVSFECEDGNMVMRLEYSLSRPGLKEIGEMKEWLKRSVTTPSPFHKNAKTGLTPSIW
ncbi:hypothetical protein CC80DRAFT_537972 [Byssothecium circinans]|uniref:Zn(2)-C6 fungal-type domain-containing protein n=1 Tax=Byssothecium circinans TaxID=147558 RepID=A0A6A5TKN0_9PLEO|nr:hypothetical protein CC80DRAFT_537972 [Byssothecium circinans]